MAKSGKGSKLYNDYLKRISGKVIPVNPRLTTIVLPYTDKSQLPEVDVTDKGDDIVYTLTYGSGEKHTILLTKDDITVDIMK